MKNVPAAQTSNYDDKSEDNNNKCNKCSHFEM